VTLARFWARHAKPRFCLARSRERPDVIQWSPMMMDDQAEALAIRCCLSSDKWSIPTAASSSSFSFSSFSSLSLSLVSDKRSLVFVDWSLFYENKVPLLCCCLLPAAKTKITKSSSSNGGSASPAQTKSERRHDIFEFLYCTVF
jgi:hypothetical protein